MKRLIFAVGLMLAAILPGMAAASPVTHHHAVQYGRAYQHAVRVFGRQTPGCKLIGRHATCHQRVTDSSVARSTAVLQRMFDPVPRPAYASRAVLGTYNGLTAPVAQSGQSQTPASGLAACIISHESGGNPQAVNGQYAGVGQWSPGAWAQYGGTKYAASPLGASYAQQVAVLNGEGQAGMQQSQGQYDGC